jgi:hypothetical protein
LVLLAQLGLLDYKVTSERLERLEQLALPARQGLSVQQATQEQLAQRGRRAQPAQPAQAERQVLLDLLGFKVYLLLDAFTTSKVQQVIFHLMKS